MFRLFFLKKIAGLSIREYVERVFLKEVVPLSAIILTCLIIINYINFEFRFFLTGFISFVVFAASIYLTGLCADERFLVNNILRKVIKR